MRWAILRSERSFLMGSDSISNLSLVRILLLCLFLPGCTRNTELSGTYVSSRNPSDSLFLSRDRTYAHKTSATVIDQGTWYVQGNDIWFSDWINRGEELELLGNTEPGLSGFNLKQSRLLKKNRIYFSPYESTYFEQIQND